MGGGKPTALNENAFQNLSKDLKDFPNAEEMAKHAFFVGCHSALSHQDIEFIGEKLQKL